MDVEPYPNIILKTVKNSPINTNVHFPNETITFIIIRIWKYNL